LQKSWADHMSGMNQPRSVNSTGEAESSGQKKIGLRRGITFGRRGLNTLATPRAKREGAAGVVHLGGIPGIDIRVGGEKNHCARGRFESGNEW